jgi:hypothetical protein
MNNHTHTKHYTLHTQATVPVAEVDVCLEGLKEDCARLLDFVRDLDEVEDLAACSASTSRLALARRTVCVLCVCVCVCRRMT